jgi:hypothetical protein
MPPDRAAGELEEIDPLGRRELQRPRERCQRLRRGRHVAPLLQPGIPGDAEPAALRYLFAPQSRRAPALARRQAEARGRQAGAVGAQELADRMLLAAGSVGHGGSAGTSIIDSLVPA